MQNGNVRHNYSNEDYNGKTKPQNYVKCAICHHDFKIETGGARVCDRCWADYEKGDNYDYN
jgi:hypothetical protein